MPENNRPVIEQRVVERDLSTAIYEAKHALVWLQGARDEKVTGTTPWQYDLREARDLLDKARRYIDFALRNALDPDDV